MKDINAVYQKMTRSGLKTAISHLQILENILLYRIWNVLYMITFFWSAKVDDCKMNGYYLLYGMQKLEQDFW